MPLTLRLNGSSSANRIQAAWFNDFYNLFTGNMQDQAILFLGSQATQCLPTTGLNTVGTFSYVNQGTGFAASSQTWKYVITYSNQAGPNSGVSQIPHLGESYQSSVWTANVPITGPWNIKLNSIPTGPAGTVSRNIYRSLENASAPYYFVATISDNSTTTYTDSTPDATITGRVTPPLFSFFGGTLWCVDETYSNWCGYALDNIIVNTGMIWWNKTNSQLMEIKSSGDLLIKGTHYSSAGTAALQNSQTFDTFDYAECYQHDQDYQTGAVVCPSASGILTWCTHEHCPSALVVSLKPGNCIGQPDASQHIWPVALAGRVMVNCQGDVNGGDLVCSNGKGGCRRVQPGESSYVLGFAIQPSKGGTVGIVLRHYRT